MEWTYHDRLQPLTDSPLAVFALLDLSSQRAQLVFAASHVGLCLLAAQHGTLEGSIGGLTVVLGALDGGKGVELVDLIMDGAVAGVAMAGGRHQAVDGDVGLAARGRRVPQLLVHALGGYGLEGRHGIW